MYSSRLLTFSLLALVGSVWGPTTSQCFANDLAALRRFDLFGVTLDNLDHMRQQPPNTDEEKTILKNLHVPIFKCEESEDSHCYSHPTYTHVCIRSLTNILLWHVDIGWRSESEGSWISAERYPPWYSNTCKGLASGDPAVVAVTTSHMVLSEHFPMIRIGTTRRETIVHLFGPPAVLGPIDNLKLRQEMQHRLYYALRRDWKKQAFCKTGPEMIGVAFRFDQGGVLETITLENSIGGEC